MKRTHTVTKTDDTLEIQRLVDEMPTQKLRVMDQSNGGIALYQTDVDGETAVITLDWPEVQELYYFLTIPR